MSTSKIISIIVPFFNEEESLPIFLDEIYKVIKETKEIRFEINYQLFNLLEDKSYLESAYNQIQEKADNLEPDIAKKLFSYPIPKAIVEEWEKVSKVKN